MSVAYHMVHYRRFDTGKTAMNGATFEGLCRTALGHVDGTGTALWGRVQDRLFDATGPDQRQILLNKVADLSSAVFGEFCLVQDKDLQTLLELKTSRIKLSNFTTAEVYKIDERSAPTGSQFIRGLAYWLAIGNHVLFVKTHAMTASYMQLYFDWLLKSQTTALNTDQKFTLQAEFDKSLMPGGIGDIKNLRVKGKSAPQISISPPEQKDDSGSIVRTSRKIADRFVEFAQAVPIVEALIGKSRTESLVGSLGKDEYISVDASVRVRGRRTAKSKAQLQEIANDIADITDGDVQIEGKDGKVTDGDAILRTRMPFQVVYDSGNLLEFDNVADQLQEVYARYVKDGKISA